MIDFHTFGSNTTMLAINLDGNFKYQAKSISFQKKWVILIGGSPDTFIERTSRKKQSEMEITLKEYKNAILKVFKLEEHDDPLLIWQSYPSYNDGMLSYKKIIKNDSGEPIINLFSTPKSMNEIYSKKYNLNDTFINSEYDKYGENAFVKIRRAYKIIIMRVREPLNKWH